MYINPRSIYLVSEWCWEEAFDGRSCQGNGSNPLQAFIHEEDAINFARAKMREYIPGENISDEIEWARDAEHLDYTLNLDLIRVLDMWKDEYMKGLQTLQPPISVADWLGERAIVAHHTPDYVLGVMAKVFYPLMYKVEKIELQ